MKPGSTIGSLPTYGVVARRRSRTRVVGTLWAALTVAFIGGCGTLPPPSKAMPNMASSVTFTGTKQEAFEIARDSLLALGISPTGGSPEEGFIAGSASPRALSWGERVGVYFRERDDGSILMWVVSKRNLATNITAQDWTGRVLFQIRNRVTARVGGAGAPRPKGKEASGTCFAVRPNGLLLTAYHVVEDAESIRVHLADGTVTEAKVQTFTAQNDLAILRVNSPTPYFLPLAPTGSVQMGDHVFTIGYPVRHVLGQEPKFTEGSVSALSGLRGEVALLQMSVPIQPGNSGGPLVNERGEVVGVVTSSAAVKAFLSVTGTLPQNINWAVKADYARLLFNPPTVKPLEVNRSQAIDRTRRAICFVEVTLR